MSTGGATAERRRRIVTRTAPLIVVATLAFAGGMVVAMEPDAPAAQRFVDAWERGDAAAMYAELTPDAQDEYSLPNFRGLYDDAAAEATLASLSAGDVKEEDDQAVVPVSVRTHIFGQLNDELEIPLSDGKVAWAPNLVFPGLNTDERLVRRTRAPPRAAILAADRSPLAEGPASARTVGTAALAVVGEVGSPSRAQAKRLEMLGFPPGTLTGISGLELGFNDRLSGKPGGQLLATSSGAGAGGGTGGAGGTGERVLAQSEPERGKAVRTNIDPDLQDSTVAALGGTYGGVAVLDAKKGSVLALAGLAYSAPQPPGSTFKIITATGALEDGIVKPTDQFPVESSNSDIGREIPNAHDELCGGSFATSFADSCNTVFAPLGAELGGEKLVKTAELYGFNAPPTLFDQATTALIDPPQSTIPKDLSESVETGESAIGQGEVLATPLEMAAVSQTVANGGVRLPNSIARDPELQPPDDQVKVSSPETAATMRQLMIGVVNDGTGVAAQLPGIQVAGKTGTAELGPSALEPGQELGPGEEAPQDIDAWFTAFAPASKPKIVVAAMVVNADGDGGTVAAPIVRQVMASYFDVS